MVAYTINKKTLTITLHHHHHHRGNTTVTKAAANSILLSITRFLITYKCILLKVLYSLLPLIIKTTQISENPMGSDKKTLEEIQEQKIHENECFHDPDVFLAKKIHKVKNKSRVKNRTIKTLPPLTSPEKKTVFLDLDETLIHTHQGNPPEKFDFLVTTTIDGKEANFYVVKRPGLDSFLEAVSKKYEVVVFTAGRKEYASPIIDKLDKNGVISHRLYRDSCKKYWGMYIKDLEEVGRNLTKVVLVDDNPNAYLFQPGNAIPVKPFYGGSRDKDKKGSDVELKKLLEFFEGCDNGCYYDMRDAVKDFLLLRDSVRRNIN